MLYVNQSGIKARNTRNVFSRSIMVVGGVVVVLVLVVVVVVVESFGTYGTTYES